MEPVKVFSKSDAEGTLVPFRFIWNGKNYLINSIGRQWQDAQGQHFLVMVPGDQVLELVLDPHGSWSLNQPGLKRIVV